MCDIEFVLIEVVLIEDDIGEELGMFVPWLIRLGHGFLTCVVSQTPPKVVGYVHVNMCDMIHSCGSWLADMFCVSNKPEDGWLSACEYVGLDASACE